MKNDNLSPAEKRLVNPVDSVKVNRVRFMKKHKLSVWWFQPLWKILCSQNGNLPQQGVKIENIWNHQLVICPQLQACASMGSRQSFPPLQLQKSLVTRFWRTTGTSTIPKIGTTIYPPIPPTTSKPIELYMTTIPTTKLTLQNKKKKHPPHHPTTKTTNRTPVFVFLQR